jgi:hypothetical protein
VPKAIPLINPPTDPVIQAGPFSEFLVSRKILLSDTESHPVSLERRDTRRTNDVGAIHTMAEIPAGRDRAAEGIGRAHFAIYTIILSKKFDTNRTPIAMRQAVKATTHTAHVVDTMVPASNPNTALKVRDGCQTIKLDPTPLIPSWGQVTGTLVLSVLRASRWIHRWIMTMRSATGSQQLEAILAGLNKGMRRRRSREEAPIRAMSGDGRLRGNEGYKCCLVQESRTVGLGY